jgi:hypothetical protein
LQATISPLVRPSSYNMFELARDTSCFIKPYEFVPKPIPVLVATTAGDDAANDGAPPGSDPGTREPDFAGRPLASVLFYPMISYKWV